MLILATIIEKFRGGVQWYMMESKDNFPSICFKLKNKNGDLISFNGQSVTFRLSKKRNLSFNILKAKNNNKIEITC